MYTQIASFSHGFLNNALCWYDGVEPPNGSGPSIHPLPPLCQGTSLFWTVDEKYSSLIMNSRAYYVVKK